jgi:predicted TIM-barrel fold metal-dependent hydrolase
VPEKYRDRAPRLITLPNGGDGIIVEGQPVYVLGLAVAGRPYEEHQLTGVNYATSAGAGSSEQRLQEQERDGIDGEILYTSAGNLSFWRGIRNDDAYLAVLHAYNTFLAEEYGKVKPDRLIAMGVIPTHSVDAAVKEMDYCANAGLKGVLINTFPSGKLLPTPEDDRFWAASLDLNMPVTVHVGLQRTDGALFKYDRSPGEVAFGGDPIRVLTRFAGTSGLNAVQLVLSGIFDRYPKLKIYWAETQIGWLPYFYEQLDDVYKRSRYWMERDFGIKPLKHEPSVYIREHCYWGFIHDRIGLRLRYDVGIDKIMWGNDFPHSAGDWPNSKRVIEDIFSGVPEDEKQKILVDNAVGYFHLN